MNNTLGLVLTLAAAAPLAAGAEIPFEKEVLDLGRNETCAVADINGDGEPDIIAGENWFAGPEWTRHPFRRFNFFANYIDNFSDLPLEVNGDGAVDIISVAWGAKRIAWFENPGDGRGKWTEHKIDSGSPVEFAFLVDLDNDGERREVLPQFGDGSETAWYETARKDGGVKWVKHRVSSRGYGHGIGAGDVNGDGRTDVLTPKGWLEAPEDPRQVPWKFHPDFHFEKALGFMFVHDVDGDGLNDVVSSMAHDYGVFWLRQSQDKDGVRRWERRTIDDAWSQAHAAAFVDLTGDGRPEFLTGKRLFAHNGHDPGGREPLGLYWYERVQVGKRWEWVRHIIDYGSRAGAGMQIPVEDIDGDGDLDFVSCGKGGVFLFRNQTRSRR